MATEVVVEEVAENLEEAAEAVRRLDTKAIGFLLGGICIGVGVGFFFGYRWNKEKLRAEAFATSEAELEEIRQYYARNVDKPELEEIVKDRGYVSTPGPNEPPLIPERPLPPPVPVHEPSPTQSEEEEIEKPNLRTVRTPETEKDKDKDWSYPFELSQRSPNRPYILHQDEFFLNESGFQQTAYTYYAGDDFLIDEDETVIHNRENLIGAKTLERFGHGADDYNVLFVRNPHLELEFEICRLPGSYEIEVQGLEDESEPSEPETS
jgi:hypothetical protein